MSLFTGMAILEEHFATAYFRFNDDAASELRPDLRATDNQQEFVDRWGATARNLAQRRCHEVADDLQPDASGERRSDCFRECEPAGAEIPGDRFLHARLQGTKLGVFDVYLRFPGGGASAGGAGESGRERRSLLRRLDIVFTRESGRNFGKEREPRPRQAIKRAAGSRVAVRRYTITTEVQPPKRIHARARVQVGVKEGGSRDLAV